MAPVRLEEVVGGRLGRGRAIKACFCSEGDGYPEVGELLWTAVPQGPELPASDRPPRQARWPADRSRAPGGSLPPRGKGERASCPHSGDHARIFGVVDFKAVSESPRTSGGELATDAMDTMMQRSSAEVSGHVRAELAAQAKALDIAAAESAAFTRAL